MSEEWSGHALNTLSRAGFRRGGARQAVIRALADHGCAVTVFDLEKDLRSRGTEVGRASIYRALDQLEKLDLVHRLEIDKQMASFERVEPDGEHHHHLVCDRCGRVAPFADPGLERAIGKACRDSDFEVQNHDVMLRGLCSNCA
jgi:Fur family transcriptional regulator, ferric uptake regulator